MDPDTVQVMVSVVAVEEVTLRLFTGPGTGSCTGGADDKTNKNKGSWYRVP